MGSLARNNFTFCPIKCFFFVLVLLALTGAALVQLDDMSREFRVRKTALTVAHTTETKIGKLRAFKKIYKCIVLVVQLAAGLWAG